MTEQLNETSPETTPAKPTETQPEQTGDSKTFTQDELERIISERLKRDRESQQKQIYEGLGVTSLNELKDMLSDYNKRKQADMTELEKAQAEIQKANDAAAKARQEADDIRNQMINNGRRAIFIDAIRSNGGSDTDDLYILVQASLSDEFNKVFDDGQTTADETKLKSFIKTVQSKHPKYFGNAGAGSPSNQNGVAPNTTQFKNAIQKQINDEYGKL